MTTNSDQVCTDRPLAQLHQEPGRNDRGVDPLGVDFVRFHDVCARLARGKYGEHPTPYMAARLACGYYSPEDQYEALVDCIIRPDMHWLDVGCGRAPFPNNLPLSGMVAARCRSLAGVDPDPAITENRFVQERHQMPLEHYRPANTFDVVTARMVIEHVANPTDFASSLAKVTSYKGWVVVLTVNWWSLTTLAAHYSPLTVHHWIKRILWGTRKGDTFRTEYKMNDRRSLSAIMKSAGFEEQLYLCLPDASLLWRIPSLRRAELGLYRSLKRIGLPYIDSCILAVYRKVGT